MARIAGVDLPKEKRVEIGLTYVYGIGRKSANDILAKAGVNPDTRVKDLTDEEEAKIREVIDHGYLRRGRPQKNCCTQHQALVRSTASRGTVLARVFPAAVREPRPTLELARVRRRLLLTRRSNHRKVV